MSDAVTQPLIHKEDEFAPKRKVPKPEESRQHLQEILKSPMFQGSKRCRQFLAYVCEEALAGGAACLKERTIAVEVFGRNPQSDLADDTIVRVGAREGRKRLVQYYLSPAGAAAHIRIDIPTGSYAPDFHYASVTVVEKLPAQQAAELSPVVRRRSAWAGVATFVAIVMVLGSAAVFTTRWLRASPDQQAFTRFWEPVLHSSEPLLL